MWQKNGEDSHGYGSIDILKSNTIYSSKAFGSPERKQGSLRASIFRAFNYPSHYIVSQNGIGKITETKTPQEKTAALFRMTFGLADGTCISLESVEKPGYFLRHSNFALRLDRYQNTILFKKDATFKPLTGLADKMCLSFMSTNFPNYYIRHRNFSLYLDALLKTDPATTFVFRQDATFMPLLR